MPRSAFFCPPAERRPRDVVVVGHLNSMLSGTGSGRVAESRGALEWTARGALVGPRRSFRRALQASSTDSLLASWLLSPPELYWLLQVIL